MDRRRFLSTGVTLATAAAAAPGGTSVNVAALSARTNELRLAFKTATPGVVEDLLWHAEVVHTIFKAKPGPVLAPVATEAAESAAFVLMPADRPDLAASWAQRGLAIANRYRLSDMVPVLTVRLAGALTEAGQHDLAVGVLTARRHDGDPWAQFAVATRLADAYARKGDAYRCLSALDHAEVALDATATARRPDWARQWGPIALPTWRGNTALTLRKPQFAESAMLAARRITPPRRLGYLAEQDLRLAEAALQRGEVDAACHLLAAAIPILRRGGNVHMLRQAREARARLGQHAASPHVRDLDEALGAV